MTGYGQKAASGAITAAIVTVAVWVFCSAVESWLEDKRQTVRQELFSLPIYSESAERLRVQTDFHFADTALTQTYPARDALLKRISELVDRAVAQKFPEGSYLVALHQRQQRIIPARIGERVQFAFRSYRQNSVYRVSGIFQMKEESSNGPVVYVSGKKYLVKHMLPEFRYLFDEAAAARTRTELVNTFRDEFDHGKAAFAQAVRDRVETAQFSAAGYLRYRDGRWLTPPEVMAVELTNRQRELDALRQRQLTGIVKRHQVLGFDLFHLQRENW